MELCLINRHGDEVHVVFAEDTDRMDCIRIRKSKLPVSTALKIAKQRLGANAFDGLFPAPGVCLVGL